MAVSISQKDRVLTYLHGFSLLLLSKPLWMGVVRSRGAPSIVAFSQRNCQSDGWCIVVALAPPSKSHAGLSMTSVKQQDTDFRDFRAVLLATPNFDQTRMSFQVCPWTDDESVLERIAGGFPPNLRSLFVFKWRRKMLKYKMHVRDVVQNVHMLSYRRCTSAIKYEIYLCYLEKEMYVFGI